MPSDKQYIRLVKALEDGPATAPELAAEFSIEVANVSAQLARAYAQGIVTRRLAPALNTGRGRKPYLYSAAG